MVRSSEIDGSPRTDIHVFNQEFIERNLRWSEGAASSIFYISEEQSDLADELNRTRVELNEKRAQLTQSNTQLETQTKLLKTFRKDRAKLIATSLILGNRKYEAPQFQREFHEVAHSNESIVSEEKLEELRRVVSASEPPPRIDSIYIGTTQFVDLIESARKIASMTIGSLAASEFDAHPTMIKWLQTGQKYHTSHGLDDCIFCGSSIPEDRLYEISIAFDDAVNKVIDNVTVAKTQTRSVLVEINTATTNWSVPSQLTSEFRARYESDLRGLRSALNELLPVLEESARVIEARDNTVTARVDHSLPNETAVNELVDRLATAETALNKTVDEYNQTLDQFATQQESARTRIKAHYFAEADQEYRDLLAEETRLSGAIVALDENVAALSETEKSLSSAVRSHGPAAEAITKLVATYLGHSELSVVAVNSGYELHRHGKVVQGQPSEGEKTAIALCYFISALQEDGRNIADLIVVVDDPISSMDSRALNYACALLRARLEDAKQLFIFTHNQQFMNEIKKAWVPKRQEDTEPDSALLFLDVKAGEVEKIRRSYLIEMPKHLRGFDSEYHFLCHKVLQFEASELGQSEYWFMMPNVIRKVLEIFLAFKEPGGHPIRQKLAAIAKAHPSIDPVRMNALERLVQVESHSDGIDGLVDHSPMTIEESRDANHALIELMRHLDPRHLDPRHFEMISRQCRV